MTESFYRLLGLFYYTIIYTHIIHNFEKKGKSNFHGGMKLNKLTDIYPQAIEQTKVKIYEDIDRYLETKESLPQFEQYLADRGHYSEQIWINVWLNKVTNDVSKNEKKQFLSERGYEVQGVDRKLINKIFRDEMRGYLPFDAMEWLREQFEGQKEKWSQRYHDSKENFVKREEQKRLEAHKQLIQTEIEDSAVGILEDQYEIFYL